MSGWQAALNAYKAAVPEKPPTPVPKPTGIDPASARVIRRIRQVVIAAAVVFGIVGFIAGLILGLAIR